MPAVKPLDRISAKWARVASVSQSEFEAGVREPRKDWQKAAVDAESNYEQGVQRAIQNKRFGKGVAQAGTQKWQSRTLQVGPTRWAEGINVSTDAYERGFQPYRDVLERLQLPPRGPKGDPKNIQRVAAVAKALHDAKMARAGG